MATYYVDPSIAVAGNGLTAETAYKYLSSLPTSDGHTFRLRADGLPHRPAATIPTNLATANNARTLGANITFETYGSGDPILSGAVAWSDSVGSQTVNGLDCKVLDHGEEIDPLWFPRADRAATSPTICCPTNGGASDGFISCPQDFDSVAEGMAGYRFPGGANWGGTSDPGREVYYEDLNPGAGAGTTTAPDGVTPRYTVTIRAPGPPGDNFWSRAHAVSDLRGYPVMMRAGQNNTRYFARITDYDPEDGSVTIASRDPPYAGTLAHAFGLFFYALVAHPYGLRQPMQYATLAGNLGWIAAVPESDTYDIACYSGVFFTTKDNITFDVTKTWTVEACSHGNAGTRGGALLTAESGRATIRCGPIVARQIRNFNREGCPINPSGAGSQTDCVLSAISLVECLGIRAISFSSAGADSGGHAVDGPIYSSEGAGLLRAAGAGSGFTFRDFVSTPRASVHDNGATIYGAAKNVVIENGVIAGHVNPLATEFTAVAGSGVEANNRHVMNVWLSGRPKLGSGLWETVSLISHRDGGTGAFYDRIVAVGGQRTYFARASGKPNTGMVVQRSVLDNVVGLVPGSGDLTGITFRHCVFSGKHSGVGASSVIPYLRDRGATVSDCVELASAYAGALTDDMWRVLTLTDAFDGHESYGWLAPQLGLTLPAWGAARTLVAPRIVAAPPRAGQPPGWMLGAILNPNPLATLDIPAGVADNGLLSGTLYAGYNLIVGQTLPDQPSYTFALDVTDEGAGNGPRVRFFYEIAQGAPDFTVDEDPDPPLPVRDLANGARIRLLLALRV